MIKKITGLLVLMILLTGTMAYANNIYTDNISIAIMKDIVEIYDTILFGVDELEITYDYGYLGFDPDAKIIGFDVDIETPIAVVYDNNNKTFKIKQTGDFESITPLKISYKNSDGEIRARDFTVKPLTAAAPTVPQGGVYPATTQNFMYDVYAKGSTASLEPYTSKAAGDIVDIHSTYEKAVTITAKDCFKAEEIDENCDVGILVNYYKTNLSEKPSTMFTLIHIENIEPQVTYNIGNTLDIEDFVGVKDNEGMTIDYSKVEFLATFVPNGYIDKYSVFKKTGLITVSICDDKEIHNFTVEVKDAIPVDYVMIDGPNECYINETVQLKAIVEPEDATDKSVTWTSSDPSIASIDENGLVTGLKKGKCVIELKSNAYPTKLHRMIFEVKIPVENVVLNTNNLELIKWNKATLKATVLPKAASEKDVEWISENTNIATVNSKGVVRGVGEGTTRIICQSVDNPTAFAVCDVTVAKVRVNIVPSKVVVRRGKSVKVVANVTPNFDYVNQNVKWISSNPKIATVNQFGVITGIKKGTCKVKAVSLYDGKTYDTMKVGVVNK